MADIPYFFRAIPDEFLSDDFIKDPTMMKFIRYIMQRIKYVSHTGKFTNNKTLISLELQPFEFVYGREQAAIECGCSHKKIRTRIERLRASSYLQEIFIHKISPGNFSTVRASSSARKGASSSKPKRASTFTVYRLMSESFKQNKGQQLFEQKGQQMGQQFGTKKGHNIDVLDNEKIIDIKDEQDDRSTKPKPSPFTNSESQAAPPSEDDRLMSWLEDYRFPDNTLIHPKALLRWFTNYSLEEIVKSVKYYEKCNEKKLITKPEAYIENCLAKRYWETDELRERAKEREKKYKKTKA